MIPQLQAGQQAEQQLGQAADRLALEAELGRGQLGLGHGRLALDTRLGLGQLGLGYGRLGLDTQLGLGQLGLARQEQAFQHGPAFALQEYLGRGQLGLGHRQADISRELGLGELSLGHRQADIGRELGLGELSLGQRQADITRELGLGELSLGRGRLGLERELGLGQLDLARSAQEFQQGPEWDYYKLLSGQAANREAASLAADIANRDAQLQLAGLGQAGQFLLGLGNLNAQAAQQQQLEKQAYLEGMLGISDLGRSVTQDRYDAYYQDFLRRQGLSEASTFGPLGSSYFPTTAFSNTDSSKF